DYYCMVYIGSGIDVF
nr:immunoglobulin light chain junction region [Macaca mulatta]MOX78832.1 immunoglobulin light chain junction region [Macaca mulatta]MOX78848.1 immunoglobulin light chain junction region [Macaca mulatta]MOX80489.1 immunoglobulin light chain junction region [Macaca mulatta]MOX82248.1 immunoglobulin light chain junction region [Macaca mulatta]